MTRPKDMTPEEKAEHLRAAWRRNKARQRSGEPSKHRRGQVSRKSASELLYGPQPEENLGILVQQIARLPLGLIQRLDNAAEALKDRIEKDKTQIMIDAVEKEVQRLEKLYNRGKPFPTPPPGKGLRKYVNGESEE